MTSSGPREHALKDELESRAKSQFGFKGVELRHSDQFKVGTKIFEIDLNGMK